MAVQKAIVNSVHAESVIIYVDVAVIRDIVKLKRVYEPSAEKCCSDRQAGVRLAKTPLCMLGRSRPAWPLCCCCRGR